MLINFYNNLSNDNVINKDIKLITSKNIILRSAVNEKSPMLLLHNQLLDGVNYVEIPKFKRCYFIENTEAYNNQLSIVYLTTDLLMTYQNDILNNEVIVTATEKPSYASNQLPTTQQLISDTYESDTTLPTDNTIVLTTIGG